VWLGPRAPADVVDRLAAAGVRTVQQSRASDAVTLSARSGVAVAGRSLLLAAGFALLLALFGIGLVAGAERADAAADARVLRVQGVRAAVASGVALRRHLWPAAAALVVGPLLGALAWAAALPAVPLFPDASWPVRPPALPTPGALALPWAVGAAVVLAASLLAALPSRRRPPSPS
jgi:putative ABC transport system permease protein